MNGLEKTMRSLEAFAAGGLDDLSHEERILLTISVNALSCLANDHPRIRLALRALLYALRHEPDNATCRHEESWKEYQRLVRLFRLP